jgi:hypothetical protein
MTQILVFLSLVFFINQFSYANINPSDEKNINKVFSELKIDGGAKFATNVKNTLSNLYCTNDPKNYPDYVVACNYPSEENKRKEAKCYIIKQAGPTVVAASGVVYGQGGVAELKEYSVGKNQTPLGLFEISSPENRDHHKDNKKNMNAKAKSEIAKIIKSNRLPAMNSQLEAHGPIFYPEENSGFGSSLGSPVFFGNSAKNILGLLKKSKKTLLLNSSRSTEVAKLCE